MHDGNTLIGNLQTPKCRREHNIFRKKPLILHRKSYCTLQPINTIYMKKLSFLVIAATALTFAACDKGPEKGPASLTATPEGLTFVSTDNTPQTVTVKAENVEWDFTIPDAAKEWLKAERNDVGLSVTVTDNTAIDSRNSEIKIKPVNNTSVSPATVLVSQGGTSDLYSIEVDKTELTFAGENNEPQEITVTTEGGLTWTCAMDPIGKTWVTTEVKENKIIVTVADNPKYEDRSGKLTVTPAVEGIDPVTVTITQTESTIDPYVRVDKENIDLAWNDTAPRVVTVESFGAGWTTSLYNPDEPDGGIDWFVVETNNDAGTITVTARRNVNPKERVGHIIITPTIATIDPVTVVVTQGPGEEGLLTTLTGDLEFPAEMLNGYARLEIQKDQPEYQDYTDLTIQLYSEGLPVDEESGNWDGTGTGGHIEIILHSERLEGDEYNYLPSTTFNVDDFEGSDENGFYYHYPTVQAGVLLTFPMERKAQTWYTYYEDGKVKDEAPITGGNMTVTREGEGEGAVYTIEFNFEDDAHNKLTGTFKRAFSKVVVRDNAM